MQAYFQAIQKLCPGKVVCEVGLGLGPLSLMALNVGAERVYGIEVRPNVLELAQRVIRNHGYDEKRFVGFEGLSTCVELPERVDVILSETLDGVVFGENTALFLLDACERFLKPGGVIIPEGIASKVALANPVEFERQLEFWSEKLQQRYGLNYRDVATELNLHNQSIAVTPDELLSDWTHWHDVEFAKPETIAYPRPVELWPTRPGLARGFAVAFEATLAQGVHLRTFPSDPGTSWKQGFSPFRHPVECSVGDLIWLDVQIGSGEDTRVSVRPRVLHIDASRAPTFIADLQRSGASRSAEAEEGLESADPAEEKPPLPSS